MSDDGYDDGEWEDCPDCGSEGFVSLYDEDPLWYDEDDEEPCQTCMGAGGWARKEVMR